MKKITSILILTLVLALMFATSVLAKPCSRRNQHCRPPGTATTAVASVTIQYYVTIGTGGIGTAEVCPDAGCETPMP